MPPSRGTKHSGSMIESKIVSGPFPSLCSPYVEGFGPMMGSGWTLVVVPLLLQLAVASNCGLRSVSRLAGAACTH